MFRPDKLRDVPGRQEIEIGLARLYRVTGAERYLRLAKFFLDMRGRADQRETYGAYCQDHLPATQQREAVGHAVRAGYMYAAMTDIAALTGDANYAAAVEGLWANVVGKKLALTGGVGARYEGEAFGADYELPNLTAYNETCAAQANILWNQRMFLLTGDAKHIDILERSLYNGFLSGVGMDGKTFYYVNPLACDGEYRFNRETSMARQPWYETACCPTNVVRLLPSLAGYIYAAGEREVFVNLFIAGRATFALDDCALSIAQTTNYPWDGDIQLDIAVSRPAEFALKLRLPSFASGKPLPGDLYRYMDESSDSAALTIEGEPAPLGLRDGYAVISRRWSDRARVNLRLPLRPRRVLAHPAVSELQGMVALERGPIVYALEAADNGADVLELTLEDSSALSAEHEPDLLGGVTTLGGSARDKAGAAVNFSAIPYYAWGHRSAGKMTVWLKRQS